MGMSTHIEAFIPDTDTEYQKQKNVLLACLEAGVGLPEATAAYFGGHDPELCMLDDKLSVRLEEGVDYVEYRTENNIGFEVDLSKLPKGVSKIRFYNNW